MTCDVKSNNKLKSEHPFGVEEDQSHEKTSGCASVINGSIITEIARLTGIDEYTVALLDSICHQIIRLLIYCSD